MLMSNLTHRSIACKAHFERMTMENVLYKFITITITMKCMYEIHICTAIVDESEE